MLLRWKEKVYWAMPASDSGMKGRASKPSIIKVELVMGWIIELIVEWILIVLLRLPNLMSQPVR